VALRCLLHHSQCNPRTSASGPVHFILTKCSLRPCWELYSILTNWFGAKGARVNGIPEARWTLCQLHLLAVHRGNDLDRRCAACLEPESHKSTGRNGRTSEYNSKVPKRRKQDADECQRAGVRSLCAQPVSTVQKSSRKLALIRRSRCPRPVLRSAAPRCGLRYGSAPLLGICNDFSACRVRHRGLSGRLD
jgi:hypothetical protein